MGMRRDAYLDELASHPLLAGHRRRTLELVGKVATPLDLRPGTVIIRQGTWAALFVLIASGTAALERHGRRVGQLGPGDHVGELVLLRDQPHDASVVALTPLSVYVLDRRGFSTMLHGVPGFALTILLSALERLDPSDSAVTSDSD